MSGPFKMKGSPMKRNFGIGASPAKQVLVSDTNKKAEGTSEKIGPERSPEGYKKLLRKRDDAAMNLKVSDEQAHKDQQKVGEEITEARKYRKTNPKRL